LPAALELRLRYLGEFLDTFLLQVFVQVIGSQVGFLSACTLAWPSRTSVAALVRCAR